MEIIDQALWDKGVAANQDPYGGRVYSYAKDWAELMEKGMAEGATLEDIADSTSHTADYDGITGFMYGAAVSVLFHTWKYGDQLRRWHNLKTQIGHEGERANETGAVLNPAILTIES